MKSSILITYYNDTPDEELKQIYEQFMKDKDIGNRCKGLLPCAEWLKNILVGADLTTAEYLALAEKCLFGEIAKRYFYK